MVTAMGGYLPRVWWTDATWAKIQAGAEIVSLADLKRMKKDKEDVSNVVAPEYGVTVGEQNANALTTWMHKTGATEFGWSEASDMEAAQTAANQGQVVILLAANTVASKSGHVSVVLAESNDHKAGRDETTGQVVVPLQSQAGAKNFKYSSEGGAPGSTTKRWWDDSHKDGAAWIFGGPLGRAVSPEEMGMEGLDRVSPDPPISRRLAPGLSRPAASPPLRSQRSSPIGPGAEGPALRASRPIDDQRCHEHEASTIDRRIRAERRAGGRARRARAGHHGERERAVRQRARRPG